MSPELKRALEHWFDPQRKAGYSDDPNVRKLVFLLDHDYTSRSLHWQRLKGADQKRASALKATGEAIGCNAYLALVNLRELWSAELDEPRYYRDWYAYEDDDEEPEEDEPANNASGGTLKATVKYALQELIERSAELDHWLASTGENIRFPAMFSFEDDLCWLCSPGEKTPVLEEYEGYMGNYRNTLEREYRRAALVLWPSTNHYGILAKAGTTQGNASAISELLHNVSSYDGSALDAHTHSILSVWPGRTRSGDSDQIGAALELATHLDSSKTAADLLISFSITALKKSHVAQLAALEKKFKPQFLAELFSYWSGAIPPKDRRALNSRSDDYRTGRIFEYEQDSSILEWLPQFPAFCASALKSGNKNWKCTLETVFNALLDKTVEKHARIHASTSERYKRTKSGGETKRMLLLIEASCQINQALLTKLVDSLLEGLTGYQSEVPIAVLEALSEQALDIKTRRRLEKLKKQTRDLIQQRINDSERLPGDWHIMANQTCTCEDCKALFRFLHSDEVALDMPLAKDRRRHIHGILNASELPVSYQTLRKGRPFVLQIRKTSALFTESAKTHSRETALLMRRVLQD